MSTSVWRKAADAPTMMATPLKQAGEAVNAVGPGINERIGAAWDRFVRSRQIDGNTEGDAFRRALTEQFWDFRTGAK